MMNSKKNAIIALIKRRSHFFGVGTLSIILLALVIPQSSYGQDGRHKDEVLTSLRPSSANPFTALLPEGSEADFRYWKLWLNDKSLQRRAASKEGHARTAVQTVSFVEFEPNDEQITANPIAGFGFNIDAAASISGALEAAAAVVSSPLITSEENGSVGTATGSGLTSIGFGVEINSTIGDGFHGSGGSGTGDYDHFAVFAPAGSTIIAEGDRANPGPIVDLDPIVGIFDQSGALLALNDDENNLSIDSYISYDVQTTGLYYVAIGSWYQGLFQSDGTDPASGPGSSVYEGDYVLKISLNERHGDWFEFNLNEGDILGASLLGSQKLTVYDQTGKERHGSRQDFSGLYGSGSPLPAGGDAVVAYVADQSGIHALKVGGAEGAYVIDAQIFRAESRVQCDAFQTIYVDFDGAVVDANGEFGAGPSNAVLSPLSTFMTNWGLSSSDENALIDLILATIDENLRSDLSPLGNADFAINIENSRDHPDPGDVAPVSRLVIGGTRSEIGFNTIGIASEIDVGNFDNVDLGVVLLDLLSAPSPDPNSLNSFGLAGGANKIDLVGVGIGNVASHEAGHFLGNYHTQNNNATSSIQDQGANLPNHLGVGQDNIYGTADDIDVDFVEDVYASNEDFTGFENQADRIHWSVVTENFEVCDGLLPVELSDFRSEKVGDGVTLKWTTRSETNNAGFYIQSLVDSQFEDLHFVEGFGTTLLSHDYEYHFPNLSKGAKVFRLKQVDHDGRLSYSSPSYVELDIQGHFHLTDAYPNPFVSTSTLHLTVESTQNIDVSLYDNSGQFLRTVFDGVLQRTSPLNLIIEASDLPAGVYFLQVRGEEFAPISKVLTVIK